MVLLGDALIENSFRNMYAEELETEPDQTHMESERIRIGVHLDDSSALMEARRRTNVPLRTGFDFSKLLNRCLLFYQRCYIREKRQVSHRVQILRMNNTLAGVQLSTFLYVHGAFQRSS